jgi:hypothetical protein
MNEARARDGGAVAVGSVLVVLGLAFLAGEIGGVRFGEWLWPFLIIAPGLGFFVGMILGGPKAGALAIPGAVITSVGVLLLFQNTFGYFASWAYAWALIVVAVGFGLVMNGVWSNRPGLLHSGWRLAGIGLILFAVGFFFFEWIINLGGLDRLLGGRFLPPLLLIGLGVLALMRGFAQRTSTTPQALPEPPAREKQSLPAPVEQPVGELSQ